MTRAEAKANILMKIDEISPFDNADIQWDSLIEGMLDSCVRQVYESVPARFLKSTVLSFTTLNPIRREAIERGSFAIPSTCIRIIAIHSKTWSRPITTLITPEMPEYNYMNNIFVKGGADKPKGYIHQDYSDADPTITEERITISPYTFSNTDADITVYYVPMPSVGVSDSDTFDVQADLLDGIFWFTAYSVLVSMKEFDFSKAALSKYQEFLTLKKV